MGDKRGKAGSREGKPQSENSNQIFYEQGHSEPINELSSFGADPKENSIKRVFFFEKKRKEKARPENNFIRKFPVLS